jgi:hypothetical protein
VENMPQINPTNQVPTTNIHKNWGINETNYVPTASAICEEESIMIDSSYVLYV